MMWARPLDLINSGLVTHAFTRPGRFTRTVERRSLSAALFAVGFATFLNLYATQPLLPHFRQAFGASELMVSLTVSAPVLAVALAAPFVGMWADRFGRKGVILAAMLGLTVPTALAATSATLEQLIVWRFLQGLFIPGIVCVTMAYISEESPSGRVGSTMATYVTGTVVGGFAGRFATAFLTQHWHWRIAMLTLAMATLFGALATGWLLPVSKRFVRQAGIGASLASLRTHARNPQLLATYLVGFNVLFCLVGAFTYVNFYLTDAPFRLGTAALGLIFGVYLIGAGITPLCGRLLDRIGYRRSLVAAAALGALGILCTAAQNLPLVIVGLALAASGAFASQAAASSQVGQAAGKARSGAAGLYVSFYYLGGFAGSVVPGLLWKHAGWIGCVALIFCLQTVTGSVAYSLWREKAQDSVTD